MTENGDPYARPSDPAKRISAVMTDGPERAPARAMLKAVGFTDEDLAKPLIGFGGLIIDALTSVEEVRRAAHAVLPWMIVAPLISVWSYQFDGIFFGATRGAEMRNAMIASLAIYLVAVEIFVPLWANHGLWLAFLLFMAARGLTLAAYYPRIARDFD